MAFSLDSYKAHTERLTWDDLDLGSFGHHPLSPEALRCLRYMHDIEYHTICYLRDLLLSPAHGDPEVTSFLSLWAYEEFWHGEALAAVLEAHAEPSGNSRVALTRAGLGVRDRARPLAMTLGGWAAGADFTAVHMAWGAVNEWTTQAGYSLLSRKEAHPVLTQLLSRIMRQEGRHIDFYSTQARDRLAASERAQRLVRMALRRFWRPVGSRVMPPAETWFLAAYLMAGEHGAQAVRRVDANIERLPGLTGLNLLQKAVARALRTNSSSPAAAVMG